MATPLDDDSGSIHAGRAQRRHFNAHTSRAQASSLTSGLVVSENDVGSANAIGAVDDARLVQGLAHNLARPRTMHMDEGDVLYRNAERSDTPASSQWVTEAMAAAGTEPVRVFDDGVGYAVKRRPTKKMVQPPVALQQRQMRADQGRLFGAGMRGAREFFTSEPSENHAVKAGYIPGYAGHVPKGNDAAAPPPRSLDKGLFYENHRSQMVGSTKHVPRHS